MRSTRNSPPRRVATWRALKTSQSCSAMRFRCQYRIRVIYVNAGVVAPPGHWLHALRPGARMIFPWRPTPQTALAALITHTEAGFEFKPLMPAWFIPCLGASETSATDLLPDTAGAWKTRSVYLKRYRA